MPDRNALTLVFLGAVFGSSFLFMRVAAPEVGPVAVAEGRVVVATVLLAMVAGRPALRTVAANWRGFAVLGFFNVAVPFTLISFAEVSITASLAALLNATVPMFAAIVGAIWLGQPLTRERIAGIGLGFAGVGLLVGWSPVELTVETLVAVVAMLGATMGYAIGLTYARQRFAPMPPLTAAVGQLAAATVMLAPLALATLPAAVPSAAAIGSILTIGILCTAVAWPLLFRLLGRFGPTATSTVTFLAPAFGIAWGGLFLAEPVGLEMLPGSVLVAASLVLIFGVRVPWRRSRREAVATVV